MLQDMLDNLTDTDAGVRLRASAEVGNFALGLRTLDSQTKHDFERLCRQADTYSVWPDSEQARFSRLIQSVRAAAQKEGKLFDTAGNPIWNK